MLGTAYHIYRILFGGKQKDHYTKGEGLGVIGFELLKKSQYWLRYAVPKLEVCWRAVFWGQMSLFAPNKDRLGWNQSYELQIFEYVEERW